MRSRLLLPLACVLAWLPFRAPAAGQDEAVAALAAKDRVVVVENVRLDYAQVLNVEPVYQTLRASRMEERCEPEPAAAPVEPAQADDEGRFSRLLDSVRGLFGAHQSEQTPVPAPTPVAVPPTSTRRNCRIIEVPREFRRPIAYDVDYVYKGTKYRSRLPEDPGNRLRVRVSVTPYIPNAVIVPKR